jgi:hypothetical protein
MGLDSGRLPARLDAARARLAERIAHAESAGPAGRADAGRRAGVLDPREAAVVREALGTPHRERIVQAMDEIELQVGLEDVVTMMVRSVVEAAQEFFEVMAHVYPSGPGSSSPGRS